MNDLIGIDFEAEKVKRSAAPNNDASDVLLLIKFQKCF